MAKFNKAFKVQCVAKALSKHSDQTVKEIADHLGVGYPPVSGYFSPK